MKGLRRAPLLWCFELQKMGGPETFGNTLFGISTSRGFILILVYVDDLLVAVMPRRKALNRCNFLCALLWGVGRYPNSLDVDNDPKFKKAQHADLFVRKGPFTIYLN
jgi:hypothetical protein